mmetsp:Transcript_13299/g.19071  ORF Transcript_13299/g.19071 Transcript_13299/m.19071 type:complete len:207 (+) Transcript_13299:167-787(+)
MNRAATTLLRLTSSRSGLMSSSVTQLSSSATRFAGVVSSSRRSMGTSLIEVDDAGDTFKKSCYFEMDFTISEDAMVYEAVQRFAAFDVGAFVTLDANGNISGVISERDYINKVALLGRKSKDTKIKEISTRTANLLTAKPEDSIDDCMKKMLEKSIRHLPLLDDKGKVIGMLSIKDIVRAVMAEKEKQLKILSDFALGKGGHFGGE